MERSFNAWQFGKSRQNNILSPSSRKAQPNIVSYGAKFKLWPDANSEGKHSSLV